MKFCKNLQRVVDISDPEWAPYWPNYKMLKKLIKELPSLVPSDDSKTTQSARSFRPCGDSNTRADSPNFQDSSSTSSQAGLRQQHGDKTAEKAKQQAEQQQQQQKSSGAHGGNPNASLIVKISSIGKSPGEVAFFKLLHTELKKAARFFDRASEEFSIREERVREGMEIMRQPNSIMVNEKWTLMGKSIYRLYKDLLLLETFAIMTYCSFSKILKKHDKNTGYETRIAFMTNIVNNANFTHYPKVLEMINRCERLYEEVAENLLREGKEGLYEDERLFINMIHRLNEQVLGSEDSGIDGARKEATRRIVSKISLSDKNESHATSKLRTIVEENEKKERPAQVDDQGHGCDDSDEGNSDEGSSPVKREVEATALSSPAKRQRAL